MTNFMTLCQWNKETEIVIKCRKLSSTCRKLSWRLSQIVVTFFFPVPFPPSPFSFRRLMLEYLGLLEMVGQASWTGQHSLTPTWCSSRAARHLERSTHGCVETLQKTQMPSIHWRIWRHWVAVFSFSMRLAVPSIQMYGLLVAMCIRGQETHLEAGAKLLEKVNLDGAHPAPGTPNYDLGQLRDEAPPCFFWSVPALTPGVELALQP